MSDKKYTVLVVDDSAADLQVTMSAISNDYKVLAAKNGQQALLMLDKVKPDVILLDVNMPEMDGYEACEQIVAKNDKVDVIFISSNESTEEIMKGYEVGGSDYIVKPVMPDVLAGKVKKTIAVKEHQLALRQEIDMASKVAMTAMSSSGELSVILEFLRNSFKSKSQQELAALMRNSLLGFEMQCSFNFQILGENYYYGTSGDVSPLERELLGRISTMEERISDHGKRLFINNDYVSLLIKNMPVEDPEKAGRLKDYLAILTEGATEKLEIITQQVQAANQRSVSMTALIEEANDSLAYIHSTQKQIEEQNIAVLDDLVKGVEEAFVGLGLTEEQEQKIMDLLSQAQDQSTHLFHKNAQLETELENVVAKFKQFIN
ncbi:MAG: response regulator [Alteromonadaceae bacterium]|nr:response regulator [Alteromonadaceae bacterium]